MMCMIPLRLLAMTVTNAFGAGNAASVRALREGRSALRALDIEATNLPTWIGRVDGLESAPLEGEFAAADCRNNRLAALGLEQDGFLDAVRHCVARHGATRVGLFVATSTSGIQVAEAAYLARGAGGGPLPWRYDYAATQGMFSLARYLRARLGLRGPVQVVSTACSSSAKVFATAARHIRAGLCDAALVGGVDSLCLTTLHGFHALELLSSEPCRPWDVHRRGISIGEAAAFALVEPVGPETPASGDEPCVLGVGETSDAWHMSSPHPDGTWTARAMREALAQAGIEASAVDYINLHGTGTLANDAAEDRAVREVFGADIACSSTKGGIGHTLGASGLTEALFCALCLQEGFLPPNFNQVEVDPALGLRPLGEAVPVAARYALSNSFGFGGSNASVLLGRSRP